MLYCACCAHCSDYALQNKLIGPMMHQNLKLVRGPAVPAGGTSFGFTSTDRAQLVQPPCMPDATPLCPPRCPQLYPACKIALEVCDGLDWAFECLLAVQVRPKSMVSFLICFHLYRCWRCR